MKTETRYYFEVSVSVDGVTPNKVNPFHKGDKCRWQRKGEQRQTFLEAQADAIANNERPYRIKKEFIQVHEPEAAA